MLEQYPDYPKIRKDVLEKARQALRIAPASRGGTGQGGRPLTYRLAENVPALECARPLKAFYSR